MISSKNAVLLGSEPPVPLTTSYLAALTNIRKEDEQRLLDAECTGHTIEEMHVVKRAGQWSSTFHNVEQRFLEREFRFFTEIAPICAQGGGASFELKPPNAFVQERASFAMDAMSQNPLTHWQHPRRVVDPATAKLKNASEIIGVVQDVSGVKSIGVDGCFEVLRPRVSIHTAPSVKASLLGVLPRYTFVRGMAFASDDGEPWLLLHRDTLDDIDLHRNGAFVPIANKFLGGGSLLKRLPGDPKPTKDSWRSSKVKEPAAVIPTSIERWKRLTQRQIVRALRVPTCVAAAYQDHWSTFLLVLEKLSTPEWVPADVAQCCSINQACGAVIALAGFHQIFSDAGKLRGLEWLPSMPLHEENIGQVQATYCEHFNRNRKHLGACMSPSALMVCERLCNFYSNVAKELLQPPITLLHGNFHPGILKFSVASIPPAVAAYDWQFVCRGRAGYDFAMFLALFSPPHVRREYEMELMMRYLLARDSYGSAARCAFKEEVRAGLLVAFVFYFLQKSCMLGTSSGEAVMRHIEWFGVAIDDWSCEDCVGGTDSPKAAKLKRGYKKKSRRRTVSPEKTQKPKTQDKTVRAPLQRRSGRQ